MTIFRRDLEDWFGKPFIKDDQGEREIREAGLALAVAILNNTREGTDQEFAITQLRSICLLACASQRA